MPFSQFVYMIVNGLMGSVIVIGCLAIIVSVFTFDLGTMFFGLVLIIGAGIVVSISVKVYDSIKS